jgi:large subunit ribosomal protein L21
VTYAIFKAAGFQYRAELGDVLRLPTLEAKSGETVTFDQVLLGSNDGEVLIGRPILEGAAVQAEVLRHGRADKIIVFKFKRRKNYRRKAGHRQDFTEIKVSQIDLGGDRVIKLEPEKKPAKKKAPAKKAAAEVESEAKTETKTKKAPAKKTTTKKKAPAKPKTTAKAKPKTEAKAKPKAKPKAEAKAKSTSKKKKS